MTAVLSPDAASQKDGGSTLRWLFGLLMNVEETARSGVIELRTADDGFAGQVAVSRGRVCFVTLGRPQTRERRKKWKCQGARST